MTTSPALPPTYAATRNALQRVAVHVLARRRHAVTGRFGLRATPGGFGTPAFGPDEEVLRIAGDRLVRPVLLERLVRRGPGPRAAPDHGRPVGHGGGVPAARCEAADGGR